MVPVHDYEKRCAEAFTITKIRTFKHELFFFFFFFFLGVCVCVLICSTLQYMFESTHMHTQAMGAWKVFVQHAVEVQLPVYSFKLVSPPPLPPPRRAGCRDSVKFGAITMARLAQLMRLCL